LIFSALFLLIAGFSSSMVSSAAPNNNPRARTATLLEDDIMIEASDGVRLAAKVCNRRSPIAVVLAHPYGPLGGNRNNNVIVKLTQFMAREGFSTIRFNARGGAYVYMCVNRPHRRRIQSQSHSSYSS
jgi:hypothetical protein